ncbi:hypothetical protein A3742_06670 [Oleiphilus sp. HI0071]|nr:MULTISPECIES: hypothetical protein [unclassified Oleiphilus]KZY72992.1 hypothetical protein A3737_09500 [Oleiphilus sp. HI0065]KZY83531.1 hypothetical protein A3742_06670 [Oleiphilus sp. HI0071]KZY97839.1 hypothetical protein A3744_01280 [Oleiphilus sp. HI0073]KZZ44856.1 hypothetical protein A3758_02605 [Oleiphilus sp. HI0118]KZZ52316.1 hypothetical protein A3760_01060 [Oleiphilus sp. HI0122]
MKVSIALLTIFTAVLVGFQSVSADQHQATNVAAVDTTNWGTRPENTGMTAEEFIRAEGLDFAANLVKKNGLNTFNTPTIASVDNQILTTPNVNVLYTAAAVDTTGGFTLNLPIDDTRLVTAQIINLNTHTTPVHLNKGGVYEFPAGQFDDHVGILVRIGVDGKADAEAQVKVIADELSVDAASANPIPDYDLDKLLATRTALKNEFAKTPIDSTGGMVESVDQITDWEKYTLITAGGWGLSGPERAAYKLIPGPESIECSTVTVDAPPVNTDANGFFSLTIYGKDMFLMTDEYNTVKSDSSERIEVTVGPTECLEGAALYLQAPKPWNIVLRAYEPDANAFMAQPDGKVTAK